MEKSINSLDYRPTWIEIDLDQFKMNLRKTIEIADGKILWPAVKADAYGHGIKELLPVFLHVGITHFCVAYLDEAIYLQAAADELGKEIKILIFADVPLEHIDIIPENWMLSVTHESYAKQLLSLSLEKNIHIQMKFDSGLNRRGFKEIEVFDYYFNEFQQNKNIIVEGIYTHFATADLEPNETYLYTQYNTFLILAQRYGSKVTYVHAQNSHGLKNLVQNENLLNAARPGAICYGLSVEIDSIKPIASLYTKITEVKPIQQGEFVSYNITFEAPEDGYIAVLPIGYADGIIRANTGNMLWINGREYPIVGRICMEQTMIYSNNKDAFHIGDVVEFFGEHIPMRSFAQYTGTIDYETMCLLSPRIKRIYKGGMIE